MARGIASIHDGRDDLSPRVALSSLTARCADADADADADDADLSKAGNSRRGRAICVDMSVKSTCYLGITSGIVVGVANLGAQVEVFTQTFAIPPRLVMLAMYVAMGCLGLVWLAMRSGIEGSLVAAFGSLVGCGLGLLVATGHGSSLEIMIGYAAFGIGHGFIAGNHLLRVSAWLLGLAALLSAALLSNAQHDLLNPAAIRLAAISAIVMAVCVPALGFAIGLAMHRRLRSGVETLSL